ncbi:hypothetical protein WKW80_32670 [Variovorax humicola]|uniref:Uncharacterized protein n=1 Tax=Variovorax humicola TaxID=1769758 RepID=A0ABU8W9S2_9BURK
MLKMLLHPAAQATAKLLPHTCQLQFGGRQDRAQFVVKFARQMRTLFLASPPQLPIERRVLRIAGRISRLNGFRSRKFIEHEQTFVFCKKSPDTTFDAGRVIDLRQGFPQKASFETASLATVFQTRPMRPVQDIQQFSATVQGCAERSKKDTAAARMSRL